MVLLCLRWGFFFAAAVLLGRIILFSHSPRTLAAFAACGLGWYLLSLRKIRSLDSSSPR